MATLTYTNPTLTNPASKTQIEQNFTDVQTVVNGQLADGNIVAGANIGVTKLAASLQECFVDLIVRNGIDYVLGGAIINSWPIAGAALPLGKIVMIPGSDGDTNWIATDVSWVCTDPGGAGVKFDVRYGSIVGGVWTNAASVVVGIPIGANSGKALEDGSVSLPYAAAARGLAIMSASAAADAALINALGSFLCVTVRLRRALQAA